MKSLAADKEFVVDKSKHDERRAKICVFTKFRVDGSFLNDDTKYGVGITRRKRKQNRAKGEARRIGKSPKQST